LIQIQNSDLKHKPTALLPRFDLPLNWSKVTLENLVSLLKDGTHNPPARVKDGIPLLASESIHDGIVDFNKGATYISEQDYKEIHRSFEVKREDLLLTIVGTLGRVAIVNTDDKFSIQRSVALIEPMIKYCQCFFTILFRPTISNSN